MTDLNGRTRAVNSKIRHMSYNMAAPASPDAVQGIMTRGKDGMSRCIFNYRLDSAGDGWYCFEDYKRNIQACLWISTGRMERDYRNYSKLINWNFPGRDLKQIPASDEPVNNYYVQSRRISHTCYYMYEHGIRREKLQKIWYTSLLLGYSMFPDFEDVRRNLLAAAGLNGVSASEYQTIMDAFDEVQITDAPAFVSGMGAP